MLWTCGTCWGRSNHTPGMLILCVDGGGRLRQLINVSNAGRTEYAEKKRTLQMKEQMSMQSAQLDALKISEETLCRSSDTMTKMGNKWSDVEKDSPEEGHHIPRSVQMHDPTVIHGEMPMQFELSQTTSTLAPPPFSECYPARGCC